jgi:hypothetical protein
MLSQISIIFDLSFKNYNNTYKSNYDIYFLAENMNDYKNRILLI